MVAVAQLVRASDCGPEGRRFDPGQPPQKLLVVIQKNSTLYVEFFVFILIYFRIYFL